jgi:glycosyltransferase involved in cell wall biosynthesis
MQISIVILTYNEAVNLPRCLASLKSYDDVVVIDSYSSDATAELATKAGARVVQNKFVDFGQQRTFAMEHVEFKYPWVFHLDADEAFTEELRSEIEQKSDDARYDAYWVPSKLMYMGQWLKYAGMYPVYQVRLGKKELLRYEKYGHSQSSVIDETRTGKLTNAYLHYNFSKGLFHWFEKHNIYSSAEASRLTDQGNHGGPLDIPGLFTMADALRRRRSLKMLSERLPFRPLLRFFYVYILCRGFLDGRAGWAYSWMLAYHEFMIVLKMRELQLKQRVPGAL